MTNEEFTTEREAVEEMAMLGDEHLEAVAALGADVSEVKEEEDECGLEPGGLPGGDSEEDIGDDNGETQRGTAQVPDRDNSAPAGGGGREDVRDLEDTGADDSAEPQGAQESPEETAEEGQKDTLVTAAVKKINGWKQANKHPYAMLICDHLIKRCREDGGFTEDVLRVDKTWDGCVKHIRSKAQRKASNGMAVIEDSVVYEWAEDYIRGAEEPAEKADKGAKKTIKVPKRNKNAQSATKNADSDTKNAQSEQKEPAPEASTPKAPEAVAEPAKEKPKPKAPKAEKPKKEKKEKKPKDAGMEGQMDLFSLFG